MAICRMRIACWTTKAKNTHSKNVVLVASPLQQWLHARASILHSTYTALLLFHKIRTSFRAQSAYYSLGEWTPLSAKIWSVFDGDHTHTDRGLRLRTIWTVQPLFNVHPYSAQGKIDRCSPLYIPILTYLLHGVESYLRS